MKIKNYWKGLKGNQLPTEEKEFSEELPSFGGVTESISPTAQTGRRDFLKMLGFSVSAAAFAASCEMPIRKSIPYIFKPEEITPGVANYYASSFVNGGDYVSVLVKTREGRPIKIEGNKQSVVTKGGTSALAQASVLNLYHGNRLKGPMSGGKSSDWNTIDTAVKSSLASGGKSILMTSTVISPSTKAVISALQTTYPALEHVTFDAISYSGIITANEKTFGVKAIPNYRFDVAQTIVSIAADFLGTWLSSVEFSADYSKNRKVDANNPAMSRHIQIEAIPSLTGSNADLRIPVKPSEEILSVVTLYNLIAGKAGQATVASSGFTNANIEKTANELWANRGKSIVVCGVHDENVQILVNAINSMLGNYGTTILWDRPSYQKQGTDAQVNAAFSAIHSGAVKTLIIADCNPVFTSGDGAKLAESINKVSCSVYLGDMNNETADACKFVAAANHYLESWNDAEPKGGIFATTQPTIAPLFKTRQWQESLLVWAGNSNNYYDFVKNNWSTNILSRQSKYTTASTLWQVAVHDGEIEGNAVNASATSNFSGVASAASGAVALVSKKGSIEAKVFQRVAVGDGNLADNPWLQELPDPLTKVTWDNYIVCAYNDEKFVQTEEQKDLKRFHVAKITVDGATIELPVFPLPGVPKGVYGIALGHGRRVTNHEEFKRGKDAYPLTNKNLFNIQVSKIEIANHKLPQLAVSQIHFTLNHEGLGGEKTRDLIKETTLGEYKHDKGAGNNIYGKPRKEWLEHHLVTLYGKHEYPGHHWQMSIDLNTCTGCSACVVACNAENNIPVVGYEEVRRTREMHWLRIDKYYTGNMDNPKVTFQPMLCQHCNNAPCENVCPVAATNHSSEGLNQMAYNRCIGTRYCANNCPYKVRRFNWFDYSGADSFDSKTLLVDALDNIEDKLDMATPLTRMVLNPDVTIRSRGVIEKCSFCVQRIQDGKLQAKKAGEQLKDGAIQTACQNACPTNAIVFGDANDKNSAVHALNHNERAFGVIEEIHTLPNVMYLTKVRNQSKDEFKA